MPQLQRLGCGNNFMLRVEGVRVFQPALQANRMLKHLDLGQCRIGDDGIGLIADALVGNTTMDKLNIRGNFITSAGLDHITRLLVLTQLNTIGLGNNDDIFNDEDATQRFVSTLQQRESTIQGLPSIELCRFPGDEDSKIVTLASIKNSLVRNQQLNHVNLLLLAPPPPPPPPPPPQQQQQQSRPQPGSATAMMPKISHTATAKFATVPNNAGASAIFKLLQARPALLIKRIKRPTIAATAAAVATLNRRQLESFPQQHAPTEAALKNSHSIKLAPIQIMPSMPRCRNTARECGGNYC
jgi:Leucine Rich repeat